MKKLLLPLFCLFLSSLIHAEPYLLMNSHLSNNNIMGNIHAIDLIVSGKSVQFDVFRLSNDEKTKLDAETSPVDVRKAYQDWFKNLKDRIQEENRTEFDFMREVIDFGASDDVAAKRSKMVVNDTLQVVVLSKDDPYWAKRQQTSGFFKKNGTHMEIYLLEDDFTKPQEILTHEVGHSLGIADSYLGGANKEDLEYSTDIRATIMDGLALVLTCDDADALAASIYVTMKKKNPDLPDFEFESFCKKEDGSRIKIRNAKQRSRKPSVLVANGKYYITEFCDDGNIKSQLEINPREPKLNEKKDYSDCKVSIPFEYKKPEITSDASKNNYFVDLTEKNRKKITPDANTVVYEYAPKIIREITFNGKEAKTTVKVKNEKGQLLYVFMLLDDKRAFAFSPNDSLMVLYDLKDYKKYSLALNDKVVYLENNPDAVDLMPDLRALINKDRRYVVNGTFADRIAIQNPASYVIQAVRWQNYLQEYYPHKELKIKKLKIDKKEAEAFGKNIKFSF